MKTLYKLFFIILFFTRVPFIFTQTLDDVRYEGRYVDLVNGKFYDSDFYITFYVHDNMNTILGATQSTVSEMADLWNNVNGSYFNFNIQSGISAYPIVKDEYPDPQVRIIGADDPDNPILPLFNASSSNKANRVAAKCYNHQFQDVLTCSQWYHPHIRGGDIVFNGTAPFKIFSMAECGDLELKKIELQSVILHELGHAAGILHHKNSSHSDVMHPKLFLGGLGCKRSSLNSIDEFAIKRLYSEDEGTTSSIPCSKFEPMSNEECVVEMIQDDNTGSNGNIGDCPSESLGMTINGQSMEWDGVEWSYPCLSVPILLQATGECSNPQWIFPYITETEFCGSNSNPLLCNGPINLFLDCECSYFRYRVHIYEVCGNSDIICGPMYTYEFKEQRDIDAEFAYESLSSILITQNILSEMGISLQAGKAYRIILSGSASGQIVQKFKIIPEDIYYANTNLVNSWLLANAIITPSSLVSTAIGRNVTLDNVTTTNYFAQNNIDISATNSISISNSVITSDFVARIIDDPACLQQRKANPDADNENFSPARSVYYETKAIPVKNSDQETAQKRSAEELISEEIENPIPQVIPNPSSNGKFTLLTNSASGNLIVYNILGEPILQQNITISNPAIDISSNAKGIYFVKVQDENGFSLQKVVYQ